MYCDFTDFVIYRLRHLPFFASYISDVTIYVIDVSSHVIHIDVTIYVIDVTTYVIEPPVIFTTSQFVTS